MVERVASGPTMERSALRVPDARIYARVPRIFVAYEQEASIALL